MGHSRTPTQNTAGDGFPADPIGGSRTAQISRPVPAAQTDPSQSVWGAVGGQTALLDLGGRVTWPLR